MMGVKQRKDIICYEKLRILLLSGELRPSDRLGETEWSKRLGGNPAALREAMTRLADQGLLRRGARGGYFVPEYNAQDMAEIHEVRAILGMGAIRAITRRGLTEQELQPLADICDTMEHLLEVGLEMGYREADRKYHDTLVALSGNKQLIRTYHNVALPIIHSNLNDPAERSRINREGLKTHRLVHKRLVEKSHEEAARLLENHIKSNMPNGEWETGGANRPTAEEEELVTSDG